METSNFSNPSLTPASAVEAWQESALSGLDAVVSRRDFFLCHASEDKKSAALPLMRELRKRTKEWIRRPGGAIARKYSIWYDEAELHVGQWLPGPIMRALASADFGIVIFSKNFFRKSWAQRELEILFKRSVLDKRVVILPVWHGVNYEYVRKRAPHFAELLAANSCRGWANVVDKIIRAYCEVMKMPPESRFPSASIPDFISPVSVRAMAALPPFAVRTLSVANSRLAPSPIKESSHQKVSTIGRSKDRKVKFHSLFFRRSRRSPLMLAASILILMIGRSGRQQVDRMFLNGANQAQGVIVGIPGLALYNPGDLAVWERLDNILENVPELKIREKLSWLGRETKSLMEKVGSFQLAGRKTQIASSPTADGSLISSNIHDESLKIHHEQEVSVRSGNNRPGLKATTVAMAGPAKPPSRYRATSRSSNLVRKSSFEEGIDRVQR